MVYKIMNKIIAVNNPIFKTLNSQTRGHKFKIFKPIVQNDSQKYFFTNRVINSWNSLPNHIVESPNIVTFKKSITSYFRNQRGTHQ